MASNLTTARSLIQADLDHARRVLDLWTHQVEELQKALEQIDAVGNSRNALRVQYQGAGAPALVAPTAAPEKPRRGRKPKNPDAANPAKTVSPVPGIGARRGRKLAERSAVSEAGAGKSARPATARKGAAKGAAEQEAKRAAKRSPKYKDPNSGKTWSGLGRRPGWFVGAPDQYAINASGRSSSNAAQAPVAATQDGSEAAAT